MLGHGGGQQSGQRQREREATELRELGKVGAFLFASVKKHDNEDEEHHDGAAIDYDLHGGDELGAHQQVKSGESDHHDNERQSAVNRVLLQNEADRADYGKRRED